ncbi:four-helix bundle copper-binding protein [Echinicola soli]|uniref:Four-helix bundle copper-binding protein n=1 Tax=Echinicola soli TaxID=2591634 RepID=A0A514CKR9_9BACT|nr:four-helix bundle copper-binding protein [Echinicola soli]QDH80347.1 four-helix bundle copper-binding protein [Echinicola soli]
MKNTQTFRIVNECSSTCFYCADACLDEPNGMVDCIRNCTVCGEVCSLVSKILSTSFSNIEPLVAYCKSICEACAKICEKHEHQHCELCAKACRTCAAACDDYLKGNLTTFKETPRESN